MQQRGSYLPAVRIIYLLHIRVVSTMVPVFPPRSDRCLSAVSVCMHIMMMSHDMIWYTPLASMNEPSVRSSYIRTGRVYEVANIRTEAGYANSAYKLVPRVPRITYYTAVVCGSKRFVPFTQHR